MEARALLLSACTATVLSDREDFLESALDWGDTERLGIHLSRDGSPEFTGPFFNPEEKPLLPIDQEQLDAIMLEFEALLSASAEHAFAQLVEGVERGISQEMYPYGAQGTISAQRRERPEDTLFSHHFIESAEGWSVYVQFESTDHLPFHEALRAHAELKERRNTRLREYVESL